MRLSLQVELKWKTLEGGKKIPFQNHILSTFDLNRMQKNIFLLKQDIHA